MFETPAGVGVPTPLQKFYLTFGVQYAHTPHPHWAGANPAGWVLIEAATEDRARGLAYLYFRENWAFLYPADRFEEDESRDRFYPMGVLATIRVGDVTSSYERAGVPTPTLDVDSSKPMFYGVFDTALVGHRIEGVLAENSDADAIENLGYEAETFHPGCAGKGREMFVSITEEDDRVLAFELDWDDPAECPVCGVSLT